MRIVGAGLALALLGACAGTVIVEYALEMQVAGRDANGREWRSQPGQVERLLPSTGSLPAFAGTRYTGDRFVWTSAASDRGFSGHVANRSDLPLCLRLDEARLASNFRPGEVALRISYLIRIEKGRPVARLGSNDPARERFFTAPEFCVDPGESASFSVRLDLSDLFPTGRMFNVRWPEGEPKLLDQGIGNWLRIAMPIEYGGRRESMEITLTVADSKARVSSY